MTWDQIASTSY